MQTFPTTNLSDEQEEFDARCRIWLERMGARDEAALTSFYEATLHRAYAVVVRILREEALVEDVLAEVYFDIWSKSSGYDAGRGRPITWLLTICRNRALDEYRRRTTRLKTAEAAAKESEDTVAEPPEDILTAVDANHALHHALTLVKPDQRQLLALAFFRGFSHQEIADYTRIPLGTVKSSIRRALKSLGESPELQGIAPNG